MSKSILAVIAWVALFPAAAHADTCDERHESCVETCKIDFGMEAGRKELERCLSRCEERREDCFDLRREDRKAQRRAEDALPVSETPRPPDVRGGEDEDPGAGSSEQAGAAEQDRTTQSLGPGGGQEDDTSRSTGERQAADERKAEPEERAPEEDDRTGVPQIEPRRESQESERPSDSQPTIEAEDGRDDYQWGED